MSALRSPAARYAALLCVLLLGALYLRLYRIDAQSLWADEGNSVAMIPRSVPEIIRRSAQDIHPPLYYLALHGWGTLFGTSAVAVRALSALFGVATVALTAALGRRIGGRRLALLGALLATLSPFAIHYSQEARMYMMVTFLGAGSWLLFLRLLAGGGAFRARAGLLVAYLAVTLAMLYTHYYALSLVVAQNLAWLWHVRRAGRRGWVSGWLAGQLLLVAAYLPWLWYARETILNWPAISPDITLSFIARELFRIFSLGLANEGMAPWSIAAFALLLLAGLWGTLRAAAGEKDTDGLGPLIYFLVPPLLMLLLSLDRPFWNPKFLLLALPGYHLLLARGGMILVERGALLGRSFALLVALLVVAAPTLAVAGPLHNEYWEPRYWRDDYRGIARTIEAQAASGDAILLDGAGQIEIFDYYYDGDLPRYPMPEQRPIDEEAAIARLEQIAARHERLFAVWWAEEAGDPERVIPRWLEAHAFEAGSRWFGNVRLATYLLADLPPPQPLDVTFRLPETTGTLELQGASIHPPTVVAGEVVAINGLWAARGIEPPVTFFAQLLDGGNHIMGQYDGRGGAPPLPSWEGRPQSVRMGVPVAVGTPPGEYRLIVGAYRSDTGQRLESEGGGAVELATVRVEAPTVPPTVDALALRPGEEREVRFDGATVVGARASKLGFDHAPESPVAPGEPVGLLLYWRAEQAAPPLPSFMLRLRDGEGKVAAEWPYEPTEGRYPATRWQPQELVRDPQIRFLPGDLPAGRYELSLESEGQRLRIAPLTVAR